MNGFQFVLLTVCVAAVCAGPVSQGRTGVSATPSDPQGLTQSRVGLSRPRRWILSWLLGHGAVIEHVDTKRDSTTAAEMAEEASEANTPSNGDDRSAEEHNLPGTVAVDLSGDTRVNYQEGRSGALAHESDAEVFDWNLLKDDKDKNSGDVNPHYYQSNSVTSGQASSGYGNNRARTATGLLSYSRGQGASDSRGNTFNRFPISYQESLEYANSRRRQ